jgi:hypothetical protein
VTQGTLVSRGLLSRVCRLSAIALALVSSLWTAGARAEDTWTTPFPGVRHLYRTASGPRRIHALEIDLCRAGVSVRATASGERRQTVASFAADVGAEVAINGDFFSYETYAPGGTAAHAGAHWGGDDGRGSGFVAFGLERVLLSRDADIVDPLPAWANEVVGGHPTILRAGVVVDTTSDLCTVRHPRTALGLSEDRHTLYLMVVDGRSSVSVGMTCEEEAAFLRGLGAFDALNLDGGGSSTMWIRGDGVVNAPSDGSSRVVSNHLAIQATGSGLPGSCMPWEPEETAMFAPVVEHGGTSDLDGDGRADVCARAAAGIRCHLATGAAFGDEIAGPALSDESGWSAPRHWETIAMGDVTGDGLADVCARAGAGMRCYPSTGSGLGAAIVGPALSNDAGWGAPERYATLRLADVDGDGTDDLCGRGAGGMQCWIATGTGFEASGFAVLAAVSDANGWDALARWGSLRMGDVNGDGLADLCGRGADGVECWLSTGIGFDPSAIAGPRWSDVSGWSAHRFFSTIRLADVDGDARADLCARSADGFRCHLSTGEGFGAAIVLDAMADDGGWSDYANYSTIRLADVDGDGDRDVCARADSGMYCWPFDGAAFGARFDGPTLSDASGWNRAGFYRTIRFGDVDGDGDEDACARASAGFMCWLSEAGAFATRIEGPPWSNASGWAPERYHATIRLGGPRVVRVVPEPDAGMPDVDAGVPGPDAHVSVGGDGSVRGGDAAVTARADAGMARGGTLNGGCACRIGRARGGETGAAMLALGLVWLVRRRRAGR